MVYRPPALDISSISDPDKVLIRDEELRTEGNQVETIYPTFRPGEEMMLGLLAPVFEPMGIAVVDQHTKDTPLPMILARSSRQGGATGNLPQDSRFMRSYRMTVTAIMEGLNADSRCAQLLEAIQHVVIMAWHNQTVVPGIGSIAHFDQFTEPTRVSDFQTATNIVQYASLPRGAVRYEQVFNLIVRPDIETKSNEFIQQIEQKGQ